jgi:hypothetical protein
MMRSRGVPEGGGAALEGELDGERGLRAMTRLLTALSKI